MIRQQLGVRQIYCLFVSDVRRGAALSKQRLAHWATQAISHAYKSAGLSVPIHCHSTRALATSWAAFKGVSLSEICAAATWCSYCTFSRFYRLNVASLPAVCAAVLSACTNASQRGFLVTT